MKVKEILKEAIDSGLCVVLQRSKADTVQCSFIMVKKGLVELRKEFPNDNT